MGLNGTKPKPANGMISVARSEAVECKKVLFKDIKGALLTSIVAESSCLDAIKGLVDALRLYHQCSASNQVNIIVTNAVEDAYPVLLFLVKVCFALCPSVSSALMSNSLIAALDFDAPRLSHNNIKRQSSESDELQVIALPYDDRRDSRGPFGDRSSTIHANQQKSRDALLAWIRRFPGQRGRESLLSAMDLINQVNDTNLPWFCKVLLCEFELLSSKSRLDKLEDRLVRSDNANPILILIETTDSFRLKNYLCNFLFSKIGAILQPLIEGDRRSNFTSDVLRVCHWPKLLLLCVNSDNCRRYEDPMSMFFKELLVEAYSGQFLLAVLPLIMLMSNGNSLLCESLSPVVIAVKRKCNVVSSSNQLAVNLLLGNIKPCSGNSDVFALPEINEDYARSSLVTPLDRDQFDGFERILAFCIPEFRQVVSDLLRINDPINSSCHNEVRQPCVPHEAQLKRKVRPVTETVITDVSIVQKRLRQWFWWQNGHFKELATSVINYFAHEGYTVEDIEPIIIKVVQLVMPKAMKGSPRMITLAACLFLELFESTTIKPAL